MSRVVLVVLVVAVVLVFVGVVVVPQTGHWDTRETVELQAVARPMHMVEAGAM